MQPNVISKLRDVEHAIALPDEQRLAVLRTTDLAVATILRNDWKLVKAERGVTEMVARRMFYHYRSQKRLKQWLGLLVIPAASGNFQQAVATYLRAFLQTQGPYEVALEKYRQRTQPDITVERDGQPLAALEVKTDLGWRRQYINDGEWEARKKQLRGVGYGNSYLLVMWNGNWSGYRSWMDAQGVRVMLRFTPNDERNFKWYAEEDSELEVVDDLENPKTGDLIHPLEDLFEEISDLH